MGRLRKQRKVTICLRRGRYVVDHRDENGKRQRPSFDSIEEAEAEKKRIELAFEGFVPADTVMVIDRTNSAFRVTEPESKIPETTLKDAIKRYRDIASGRHMDGTRRNSKYHFEDLFVYLVNEQKVVNIGDVSLLHLESFQAHLLKGTPERAPLAASTVNRIIHGTLSPFFNKCVAWGLIAKSPMLGPDGKLGVKRLPEMPSDIKPWKPEQIKIAINLLPPHVSEAEYFISDTGCRPIDACRSVWGDVSLDERKIKFTSYKGGKIRVTWAPMSDSLYEFLVAHKDRARRKFRAKDSDPVFMNTKGRPITTAYLGDALAKIRDGCKHTAHHKGKKKCKGCDLCDGIPELQGLTNYGMRHGFIDGLVSLGIHPRDIQLLARHSKFEMTTRYTHRNNDHLRSVVNNASQVRSVTFGK